MQMYDCSRVQSVSLGFLFMLSWLLAIDENWTLNNTAELASIYV
jgi:hypothetical protein